MRVDNAEWRRKHDDLREAPRVSNPQFHFFPESRQDLIDIVRQSLQDSDPYTAVRASGSHWSLSEAAVSRRYVVETRGFAETDGFPAPAKLNQTIYDVIPQCLSAGAFDQLVSQPSTAFDTDIPDLASFNYYHVEAGIRIFELYSRLDDEAGGHMPTSRHPRTQNLPALAGPWAMPTLGGAGGQTIVGAFSTGTHGGDQHQPPISDAVQAIHLIGPDAKEYWIERGRVAGTHFALTNENSLRSIYPSLNVIRDDEVFNAVLVAAGRMGIIYSVVLKVMRQYGLRQVRVSGLWSEVSQRLRNPSDPLFDARNRFLQVVVNPHAKPDSPNDHVCYVETRQPVGLRDVGGWEGRRLRGGANADKNASIRTPDFQSLICTRNNVREIVAQLLASLGAGRAVASLVLKAIPLGDLLLPLLDTSTSAAITALTPLLFYQGTLGELVTDICNIALDLNNPGLVAMVNERFIEFGQPQIPEPGLTDISYAVMDFFNYTDRNCVPGADSLTVSFDADGSAHFTFMDTLFARLKELEEGRLIPPGPSPTPVGRPMSFAGYASMRFTGRSEALLAMQRWQRTCNIEVAGIKAIKGTDPFLRRLEADAAALGATVHWGQKNESTQAQVEAAFPELDRWRKVLARFTSNGRLVNFSTPFSQAKGLEVVQPSVGIFNVSSSNVSFGESVRISWDARDNPPNTSLVLQIILSNGQTIALPLGSLEGAMDYQPQVGRTLFRLIATYTFNGTRRWETSADLIVSVPLPLPDDTRERLEAIREHIGDLHEVPDQPDLHSLPDEAMDTIESIREQISTVVPADSGGVSSDNFSSYVGPLITVPVSVVNSGWQQDNWRWCRNCQGLAFGGNEQPGICPAGGRHDHHGSSNYILLADATGVEGQDNWRWCNKCQGLAYGAESTVCPAGGRHDFTGSANYILMSEATHGVGQDNWRWCGKCQGLAYGSAEPGSCSAGGRHDHSGSANYILAHE